MLCGSETRATRKEDTKDWRLEKCEHGQGQKKHWDFGVSIDFGPVLRILKLLSQGRIHLLGIMIWHLESSRKQLVR